MIRTTVICLVVLVAYGAAECKHPSPAADYTNEHYSGLWFEIGKIQTPGGAYFQRDCVCDVADFQSEFPTAGLGHVTYSCRELTPDGPYKNATATLKPGEVAGNFAQSFAPLAPSVDYNVIWLDGDSAIEYDCGSTLGVLNYCVHFMSRTTSIEPAKFEAMMSFVESLGLNTENIEYQAVLHEGCW